MTATPRPDNDCVEIPNERDAIERVESAVSQALDRHHYPKASKFAVRLALEEAIANAFRHGHENLPANVPIRVEFTVGPQEVRVSIEDKGPGFDPRTIPDPTLDENLEQPSGRGLMLIRAYMTSVAFNDRGNRLVMVYRRPAG